MNKDKDPIFIEETEHLNEIVSYVNDDKVALEKAMERLGAFNLDKLKEIRENPATNSADFLQFLNMLDTKNTAFNVPDKYKRLEELTYLSKEPYFSRIDLKDKDKEKTRSHYIGKFGFTLNEDPIILDWRAKAASVYYKYRFPQKNIKYDTPDGIVTKDLELKRTFEIDDAELIKYYNNDIKLDENEIIVDKIGDRTGGVLEDIIETIQENQHEIIEADPRNVCIVQGTVGSGKSTVAIHKLSYIFFNYPELIRPNRSILIAKNQILVGYLSTLFPKLGIFDINYGTIRDVIYNLIFKEKLNIEFDLNLNQDTSDFSMLQINKLLDDLGKVHQEYESKIQKIFEPEDRQTFAGFVYDSNMPVRQNLTDAIVDLEEELKFQKEFIKEHPNHKRAELFRDNIKIINKIIKALTTTRAEIKSKALKKLVEKYNLDDGGVMGYKQALIYTLIHSELVGLNNYKKFEYCVMDEGQDFSVLEYAVLDKIVINGRFCILGDLNQSYAKEGLSSWDETFDVITGSDGLHKFELDTNYRSTRPIIDFANKILRPHTESYLPKSINRIGDEPSVYEGDTINDVINLFKQELLLDLESIDKSVGIICMNEEYYKKVDALLSNIKIPEDKLIKLDEADRIHYLPRAIYLSHFKDCKGLEFGKVYVLGLDLEKIENFHEAKKAFVAVTRAMDELSIYANKS